MGYFIAFRFTGADAKQLDEIIPVVSDALQAKGQEVYCTYFDEEFFQDEGLTKQQIFNHAFAKIEEMGKLFVLVDSDLKSEGMLIEAGYCMAKGIEIVVAKRAGVNTYLDQLAAKSFEYHGVEDLADKIKKEL